MTNSHPYQPSDAVWPLDAAITGVRPPGTQAARLYGCEAGNAAYAQADADFNAGGSDHSGQARAEEARMDWAVWEESNAEYYAQSAEEYAAQSDYDNAESYAEAAADHQEMADYHGDLGEHGGDIGVYDASSEVDTGGSYDAGTYDTSTTDYSSE